LGRLPNIVAVAACSPLARRFAPLKQSRNRTFRKRLGPCRVSGAVIVFAETLIASGPVLLGSDVIRIEID
jgi:hypothetical protein